jgi:hypothetical protein
MAFLLNLSNIGLILQKFQKPSFALLAALLISIFTTMMESVKLNSSAKSVQTYFSLINVSENRQNIFVLIAVTPFSNGKSVKMSLSTNVLMITVLAA